jgi:ABC-2 type transport system permease protein
MNSQRIFSFVKKDLKRMIRDPGHLFMILLFPIGLTLVFGVSFGAVGDSQSVYDVGIVNYDAGIYEWSQSFTDNLSSTEILDITVYTDIETAQDHLVQGKIQALIVIPEQFGQSCTSFVKAPGDPSQWVETTMELHLDSGSLFAMQAIPPIIQQVLVMTIGGDQPTGPSIPIQIGIPSLVEADKTTMFDYMAPGIFPFAALFLIMVVSQSFTSDREKGLLRRINTTPTTSTEFMAGHALSNMAVAVVQVALVFVMAFIVGYSPHAGIGSILFAFVIVTVFALCCVGFGLITAAVSKSPEAATGISFIFIMPQMFLGTFVTLGLSSGIQAVGKLVPSYYVTDALLSLLLRGAPASSPSVLVDLVAVSVFSIIVLMVGVVVFEKYGSD